MERSKNNKEAFIYQTSAGSKNDRHHRTKASHTTGQMILHKSAQQTLGLTSLASKNDHDHPTKASNTSGKMILRKGAQQTFVNLAYCTVVPKVSDGVLVSYALVAVPLPENSVDSVQSQWTVAS